MAGRFVRASKFRHTFGRGSKKENCFDNLRISKNAWDSNLVQANPEFISVNWEANGGGAFAVIPVHERGRCPEQIPLFRGHTAPVLDTNWNPFNDKIIASGSDDGKVFIWRVPDDFTLHTDSDMPANVSPISKLSGHGRKVGQVLFNVAAADILASSSADGIINIWDITAEKAKFELKHPEIIYSMSWNEYGTLIVSSCRDKQLRVWDVRQQAAAQVVPGHAGARNCRVVWLTGHERFASTGFSRMSDRQLGLWDIKSPRQEPISGFLLLDSLSGVCIPFWDEGTSCLYLAGKGDGNIRYYEYDNDKFEYLSEYKSTEPQRGMAFVPKRGVSVRENEVARAYKAIGETCIEPISFIVPRRSEAFQDDIYPPTCGADSAISAQEWLDGQQGLPPKISMQVLYDWNTNSGQVTANLTTVDPPPLKAAENRIGSLTLSQNDKSATNSISESFSQPNVLSGKSEASADKTGSVKSLQGSMLKASAKYVDKSSDEESISTCEETSEKHWTSVPTSRSNPKPCAAATSSQSTVKDVKIDTHVANTTADVKTPNSMISPVSTDASKPSTSTSGLKNHLMSIKSTLDAQGSLICQNSQDIQTLAQSVEQLRQLIELSLAKGDNKA